MRKKKNTTKLTDESEQLKVRTELSIDNIMQQKKEEVRVYQPPIPFTQRLKQSKLDDQFDKFLDMFKKLEINIPFVEALAKMPHYAKFMKVIIREKKNKKRKLYENGVVSLFANCSVIIQKKLPQKMQDLESFTIPCIIRNHEFRKALCDSGASLNPMPLSVVKILSLGELTPTTLSLQMVDGLFTQLKGIIEDVLIKVGKFIFPVYFVVINMEEDKKVPLLLSKPFLATSAVLIDVKK